MNKLISVTVVLCCVAGYVYAEEFTEEMKQMIKNLHDSCTAETGVPEDLIAAAKKGDFKPETSLKCYMKCLMTTIGVLDDSGEFDPDAYVDLLPESMKAHAKKVVDKCGSQPKGDPCEVAYQLNICNYGVDPAQYMLF